MNGQDIRTLRKQLGLSQREFAEKVGVSRNLIFYWEADKKNPSADSLRQLAELAKTISNSEVAVSKTDATVSNLVSKSESAVSKSVSNSNQVVSKMDDLVSNSVSKSDASVSKIDEAVSKTVSKNEVAVSNLEDTVSKNDRTGYNVRAYYEAMYSDAEGVISLCTINQPEYSNHKPSLQVKGFYDMSQILDLLAEVDKLNGDYHIYTGIHPLRERPSEGRGKEKDILGMALFAADVDAKDFISNSDERHKATEEKGFYKWTEELLSECKAKALAHINEVTDKVSLPPTAIIDSGHGYYPIFQLEQFVTFENEQHREELKTLNRAIHQVFSADSTFDFARILRVPGTRNIKPGYPADCKLVEFYPDRHYTLDDIKRFERLIEAPKPEKQSKTKSQMVSLDDQALIEKAKQAKDGAKFTALWEGDISGYDSHSEADLALCCLLTFWTGGDRDRIDRLFRQSGLYREDKWGEREDYKDRTINAALTNTTEFYDPNSGNAAKTWEESAHFRPLKEEYKDILNTIDGKLENTDELSSIEQSELIQDTLKQVAKLNKTDQARYLKLLAEKFGVTQKALKDDMKALGAKDTAEPDGRSFGNIYELDGYDLKGNKEIGYLKVEFPFGQKMISTFIIKPKSKLWIDGFEAINATFISEHETIEDVVIERKNWNSPERFMDIIPSAKMNWTGERKDIQSLMMIVSSYDVPTQIATQQLGWHKDKTWVGPNLNICGDGFLEPVKVFYYPMGGGNVIDNIINYGECDDKHFTELQSHAKRLRELNETDVTIPIIGWFHGTLAKRWWLNHPNLRHFPHLNIAGSRGSGKSTLAEILWQVFGWTGDALVNCSMTRFALLRTFSATNSFPTVLDEFKPSNMPDDRVANIREFMRHSYGGAIDQRGRPDQSIVEYHLTAPICLVGETPYYPLEAAAIERVIPIHTNFNAINPDTEQGKKRAELCWQLQQVDWTGYLPRYIRHLTTIDFNQQMEYAREDAVRYLGERNVPRRIWDNLAAMIFGLRQYESFAGVVVDDSQIEHAVQTIVIYLCGEAGKRGKLAFEMTLEQMAVMAELGRLKKEIHYLINENNQICLRLSACLSEFRRFARETSWTGEVLDDNAYRRQIAEIHEEGRLIVETTYPVRGWQGDWNKMARAVVIQSDDKNVDLSGFLIAKDWNG